MKIAAIFLATLLLTGISIFPASSSEQVSAAYTVTKTQDTNDGVCDSDCSLREAIISSNNSGGINTIYLPSGTYVLSIEGTDENYSATGDLDIRSTIELIGNGTGTAIINGNHIDRIFDIRSSYELTISGVTLLNGQTSGQGGAITNYGILTIYRSILKDNSSIAQGGAIMNQGYAVLSMAESEVYNNSSQQDGGGIFNSATMTISSSTIRNNVAVSRGGGITNSGGTIVIEKSTLSGNQAQNNSGGGIETRSLIGLVEAYLTVKNSTISGNSSGYYGGGINSSGITTIKNVTLTNNSALFGGGLSGGLNVGNTIVGGNTATNSSPNCAATITSLGYNLIEDMNGCIIVGDTMGNILGISPGLGPLGKNGGLTDTHALLSGSPAENSGSPDYPGSSVSSCELTDQRGIPRPQMGRCDMGAYEKIAPVQISLPLITR